MATQKIFLRTVVRNPDNPNFHNMPKYAGFFEGRDKDFYAVAYFKDTYPTGLNIVIKTVDSDLLKNKHTKLAYNKWQIKK